MSLCGNRSPITGECMLGCPGIGGCELGYEKDEPVLKARLDELALADKIARELDQPPQKRILNDPLGERKMAWCHDVRCHDGKVCMDCLRGHRKGRPGSVNRKALMDQDPRELESRADRAWKSQRFDEAAALYRRLLEIDPPRPSNAAVKRLLTPLPRITVLD